MVSAWPTLHPCAAIEFINKRMGNPNNVPGRFFIVMIPKRKQGIMEGFVSIDINALTGKFEFMFRIKFIYVSLQKKMNAEKYFFY